MIRSKQFTLADLYLLAVADTAVLVERCQRLVRCCRTRGCVVPHVAITREALECEELWQQLWRALGMTGSFVAGVHAHFRLDRFSNVPSPAEVGRLAEIYLSQVAHSMFDPKPIYASLVPGDPEVFLAGLGHIYQDDLAVIQQLPMGPGDIIRLQVRLAPGFSTPIELCAAEALGDLASFA